VARPEPHPLSRADRIAAAIVTGPLGHLYAGLVDLVVIAARQAWARARRRPPA
jgi:hypothetical protein